jgi:hypothetical protein
MFVHRLKASCDVLVMPLSYDKTVSLHIVRQVQRAAFRTLLITGSTTATRENTTPLFNDMLPLSSTKLVPRLLWAALAPAPARLSIDAAERQIFHLIQVENCFRQLRLPSHWQTSLSELMERDRRYVVAMAELVRVAGACLVQSGMSAIL